MNKGTLVKCPKGHEIFALEGHPIIDGLPACPHCLLTKYLAIAHTSMQLNNTVTNLIEQIKKGNVQITAKQTAAVTTFSQSSTSADEAKIMEAQLKKNNFIQEINELEISFENFLRVTFSKYLNPKSFGSGKGVVVLGLNTNGDLIVDNVVDFKIIVQDPLSDAPKFTTNLYGSSSTDDVEARNKIVNHFKELTTIEVKKLRVLNGTL